MKEKQIILETVSKDNQPALSDIVISKNARVQYVFVLTDDAPDFIDNRKMVIEENAQADIYLCYFGSGTIQVKWRYEIGRDARINHRLLFFGNGRQRLAFDEEYVFTATGAYGRFNAQGLVTGSAESNAVGNIIVMPGAQKTDSRLEMSAHILNKQARANIVPSLQVEANDVRAGHAGTVSHLDDESLFYLRSRGLSKAEAKRMIVEGVAREFVEGMEDEELRENIIMMADKRI